MNFRRDLLVTVILASATATSAHSQTSAPTGEPAGSVGQSSAPVPELSGVWAHPGLGFGPPLSGPGPIRNMSRTPRGQTNFDQVVGDYTNPILKPEAAEVVKRLGEFSKAGEVFPDPDNQCMQNPLPYIFWNFQLRVLQLPDKVVFVYQHDSDSRQIRLNQQHPAQVVPTIHGDSVGHYEGDTLVIDTVGIKLGPFRTVDRFGTPYSPALHVVERYRLIDYETTRQALELAAKEWPPVGANVDRNYRGKGLQLEFTVEDPGVFTMPWSATITYGRDGSSEWEERVCAENVQHDFTLLHYSDPSAHIPTADKPDF
jgi:hypothetical protein